MTSTPDESTCRDTVTIRGAGPLRGSAQVPGDKSISHRALMIAALADGTSEIAGVSRGDDVMRTLHALRAYGVTIDSSSRPATDARAGVGRVLTVHGSAGQLAEPERPIDLGNSGTAMRLLAGVAAQMGFLSVLTGDDSVHRRPMDRVVAPLREMGACIDGRRGGRLAPLVVRGGDLTGIDAAPSVPSAQVKSAILLAGLEASGTTVVRESVATRRHTEEILALAGVPVDIDDVAGAYVVRVAAATPHPFELDVPGDPSQAAFLAVAACVVPGSEVLIERVYVGPGRAGFLDVLRRMGADIELRHHDATTADIAVRHSDLRSTEVRGAEIAGCIDEIPVLAVAAAFAEGTTVFADAAELRVKESDRIATTAGELSRIGVAIEATSDGLVVTGGKVRASGVGDAHGDHRIAMALTVAAIGSGPGAEMAVEGFSSVATSWPDFVETFEALR